MGLILYLLVNTAAFVMISRLLPGFTMKKPETPLIVAGVYAFLVAIVGHLWFASILGLLMTIPVLGLLVAFGAYLFSFVFSFLISVGVLIATDAVLEDFQMDGLATAVLASLMLGVINTVLYTVLHILHLG